MLIDILIPTYNRSSDLIKNLKHLSAQILNANLQEDVQILISDNCSLDTTQEDIENFISKNNGNRLTINYYRNVENLGLENNVVSLLEKATSEFVLWTGDDDFVCDEYITYLVQQVKQYPLLGCVISGLSPLQKDGTLEVGRCEDYDELYIESGIDGVLGYSYLAHQMSGLLLRREGLLEDYLSKDKYRNPYLFIYFVANRMLRQDSIYAPIYNTQVAVFNEKDWGYNDVGLLDDVFKNYYALADKIEPKKVDDLLLKFTVTHSYRLAFRPLKLWTLLKQYKTLFNLEEATNYFKKKLSILFVKETILSLLNR